MAARLTIDLEGGTTVFAPREVDRGKATWALYRPQRLFLALCWFTAGKGDRDMQVVDAKELPRELNGAFDFQFTLPDSPYSFSGQLTSITWAIELSVSPEGSAERVEIVMSPSRKEIDLYDHDGAPKQ